MNELAKLRDTTERLYATFAYYPLRHPVVGCTCCVSREDQARIAAKPLRQLNGDDLERYCWKAMSTWGDANDFRHFLPRILELVSDPMQWSALPDLFIVFGKLPYGHWETWPTTEQEAIISYLLALWRWLLTDPTESIGGLDASAYLKELLDAQIDCTLFLHIWREIHTPSSLCQLAKFVRYYPWGNGLPKHMPIKAWLREAATKKALEEGFYTYMDEPWAGELALAVEVVEWFK